MIQTPTVYYGNLGTLASAGANYFPSNVGGMAKDGTIPATYNWNLTVQRRLPFETSLEVAYVGSSSNHLPYQRSYNDPGFAALTAKISGERGCCIDRLGRRGSCCSRDHRYAQRNCSTPALKRGGVRLDAGETTDATQQSGLLPPGPNTTC